MLISILQLILVLLVGCLFLYFYRKRTPQWLQKFIDVFLLVLIVGGAMSVFYIHEKRETKVKEIRRLCKQCRYVDGLTDQCTEDMMKKCGYDY